VDNLTGRHKYMPVLTVTAMSYRQQKNRKYDICLVNPITHIHGNKMIFRFITFLYCDYDTENAKKILYLSCISRTSHRFTT
jgi:hypothetical protein